MNKRILELALQASKEVWGNNPYNGSPEFEGYELDQEKFAELIVRECIAQAVKEEERYDSLGGRDCDYCSAAMANFQGVLADHFGVE